jgi:hypothetical protein
MTTSQWIFLAICAMAVGYLLPELGRLLRAVSTFVFAAAHRKLKEK